MIQNLALLTFRDILLIFVITERLTVANFDLDFFLSGFSFAYSNDFDQILAVLISDLFLLQIFVGPQFLRGKNNLHHS